MNYRKSNSFGFTELRNELFRYNTKLINLDLI
jgi:hypothetical protein